MISCHDWWPWAKPGCITMTRRQSNDQWSGGIKAQPVPKIPSAKIRCKSSRHDFLGSRRHPPHWLSSNGPNYQRGVLLISCWCNWRTFWKKNAAGREGHRGVLVLARQCPGSPGTCNPEATGLPGLPVSLSPTLTPDLVPSDYHLFPGLKKQFKGRHSFVRRGGHCCRGDVVGRTTFWIFFFLSGLQKLEQRAKKCTELRGEYSE